VRCEIKLVTTVFLSITMPPCSLPSLLLVPASVPSSEPIHLASRDFTFLLRDVDPCSFPFKNSNAALAERTLSAIVIDGGGGCIVGGSGGSSSVGVGRKGRRINVVGGSVRVDEGMSIVVVCGGSGGSSVSNKGKRGFHVFVLCCWWWLLLR